LTSSPTKPRRYIPVAEVARPHGVQGQLRLRLYNPSSGFLLQRPAVKLRMPDGAERDVTIKSARSVNKGVLVTLSGVSDRDAAEALRGAEVLAPRDAFPPAEEGEFYACDLEGAKAVMAGSGEEIGRVSGVQSYPTCDALVIDRGAGKSVEVPLVDAYVGRIDVEGVEGAVVEIVTLEGIA
jgi:16S rRNA processing protein RimM